MSYIEVTDQNFDEIVKDSQIPVLVDFWAPWCAPCRMLGPIFESLAKQYEGKIKFVKVNVDENPTSAIRYDVRGIPTVLKFKNGQLQGQPIVGVRQEDYYKQEIDSLLGNSQKEDNNQKQTRDGDIININGIEEFIKVFEDNKDKLVLVDFWAPWCGPCQIMLPILSQFAIEMKDKVKVCKVNVDENPQLAQRYEIRSIPTLIIFKNGNMLDSMIGVRQKDELNEICSKYL